MLPLLCLRVAFSVSLLGGTEDVLQGVQPWSLVLTTGPMMASQSLSACLLCTTTAVHAVQEGARANPSMASVHSAAAVCHWPESACPPAQKQGELQTNKFPTCPAILR